MTDLIQEKALYVDGSWIPGRGSECEVEDPATEATIGVVTQADLSDVDGAIDAARAAFPGWARVPVAERARTLRRLHDGISTRADEFAALVAREQGSLPDLARRLHVDVPLRVLDGTIAALENFVFQEKIRNSIILREPVGVVAAITPWNLPLHQIVVKVAPAIAAGCTVVLKPAALTPLTAFAFARAIDAAGFPPGVFNLVTGSGRDVGDYLTRSPNVDQVSFTGSTEVGRQVAAAAAATVKRLTLELGGKSASVVLSDVSDDLLANAVKVTVGNCFLNAGQTCTALSRLIVPADRLRTVEQLTAHVCRKYVPGVRLGPVISAGQRDQVCRYLSAEKASEATLIGGGVGSMDLPERGYFVPPTVYSRVERGSALAQEEIFGPVLSILAAQDDDHAVELANDSIYGLGGALWTERDDALGVAARIRTGQVDVNGAPFNPHAPFGGYKQSGIGREFGAYGLDDVLEIKAVQL